GRPLNRTERGTSKARAGGSSPPHPTITPGSIGGMPRGSRCSFPCLRASLRRATIIPMESATSLGLIIRKYLDWCRKDRAPRSAEWYQGHLDGFLAHLGDQALMPATDLKPYHVVEWVDGHETWGDTYKRGAIVAVQRALNWAEEMGYLAASPVKRIKKPP